MTIKELKALCHVCNLSEILVRISNRIVKISKYEDEGDGEYIVTFNCRYNLQRQRRLSP